MPTRPAILEALQGRESVKDAEIRELAKTIIGCWVELGKPTTWEELAEKVDGAAKAYAEMVAQLEPPKDSSPNKPRSNPKRRRSPAR